MSLTRPSLLTTTSFDATKEKIFYFTVPSVGSQITANQLIIRRQNDNVIIYQNIQNSFKYQHFLPANTLSNGEYYNATLIVLDVQGEKSPESLSIQFRCFNTPIIEFTNIPVNKLINNASYEFNFTYTQKESEPLDSYVLNLYDISQTIISSSNKIYVKNGTPPFIGKYLFAGFENKASYYIEVTGETVYGNVVTSGKQLINIEYARPNLFTLMELKNNCEKGYINLSSNIVLVGGDTQPTPPVYIQNKEIDLTAIDSYVNWNQGYSFSNSFVARAWFRNPTPYSTIIKFSNIQGQTITVDYMEGYENIESAIKKSYVQLTVESIKDLPYYIYSNYIDTLSSSQPYFLKLKRINDLYQIELLKEL